MVSTFLSNSPNLFMYSTTDTGKKIEKKSEVLLNSVCIIAGFISELAQHNLNGLTDIWAYRRTDGLSDIVTSKLLKI